MQVIHGRQAVLQGSRGEKARSGGFIEGERLTIDWEAARTLAADLAGDAAAGLALYGYLARTLGPGPAARTPSA